MSSTPPTASSSSSPSSSPPTEYTFAAPSLPATLHLPPSSLPALTNALRQRTRNTRNRIRSIASDAAFVSDVAAAYGLPLVANLRAGEWYCDPSSPRFAGRVYFKSTDGHAGSWGFSLRRLNLGLLDVVGASASDGSEGRGGGGGGGGGGGRPRGVVVVDSTRRGKRFPDALAKTLPVWMAVVNAALFPALGLRLHAAPRAVGAPERAAIEARLPAFLAAFLRLGLDLGALRARLGGERARPMRPLFVGPHSPLPPRPPREVFAEFVPVVLVTASRVAHDVLGGGGGGMEGEYIQGAGDDHEGWTRELGLTPEIFWRYRDEIVRAAEEEEEEGLVGVIRALVARERESVERARGVDERNGDAGKEEDGGEEGKEATVEETEKDVSRIAPTQHLFLASQPTARRVAARFDVVVDCSSSSSSSSLSVPPSSASAPSSTPTASHPSFAPPTAPTPTLRPFPLPTHQKRASLLLRTRLAPLLRQLREDLSRNHRILFVCDSGNDAAPAVALVALCLFFREDGGVRAGLKANEEGEEEEKEANEEREEEGEEGKEEEVEVDKALVRRRLAWIVASRPAANPSRTLLQAVNSVLMERR